MNALTTMLITAGSTAALAVRVGDEAAAQALHDLEQTVPEELRGSWPMVIAYARHQAAYEVAEALGRYEDMAKIASLQAKLLKDVY